MKSLFAAGLLVLAAVNAQDNFLQPTDAEPFTPSNTQLCNDWGIIDIQDHMYMYNNKWGSY